MHVCCICKKKFVKMAIDFGKQPISNRFLSLSSSSELTYSFQLGYCEACSLVQLINPPLSEDLKPSFSWITYNEPENHLDSLVDELIKLPGVGRKTANVFLAEYGHNKIGVDTHLSYISQEL